MPILYIHYKICEITILCDNKMISSRDVSQYKYHTLKQTMSNISNIQLSNFNISVGAMVLHESIFDIPV